MIQLTSRVSKKSVYLAPEHIAAIIDHEGMSAIHTGDSEEGWVVLESPEEVVRKIINYKLSIIDFTAHSTAVVEMLMDSDSDVYEGLRTEYARLLGCAGLE